MKFLIELPPNMHWLFCPVLAGYSVMTKVEVDFFPLLPFILEQNIKKPQRFHVPQVFRNDITQCGKFLTLMIITF